MSPHIIQILRGAALLMALIAGVAHIADLWFDGLSENTVIAAGRGGLLLLLALGLMGTGRLALVLVAVFCGVSLFDVVAVSATVEWITTLEVVLSVICVLLLLIPDRNVIQDI
ncbi:MAG: hypothetical protein V2I45_02725 [Halieaceae bacterium]|nr:hypothetical protein [Halieaceae bacterium]